jgi:hypothetical protein
MVPILDAEQGKSSPLGRRSDGRAHDTGMTRPYRPCPPDFREVFIELGQSREIEEHYHTNWRVIVRWIGDAGGEDLRAARREVTGASARPNLRSKRYVLGLTLSGQPRNFQRAVTEPADHRHIDHQPAHAGRAALDFRGQTEGR